MIDNKTELYISASNNPGNFGASVFNTFFKIKHINAVYLPRKFNNAEGLVKVIQELSISACGVSSPLKTTVLGFLDQVDETAQKLNSVNTIVNKNGKLIGYNTDWSGAKIVLEKKILQSQKTFQSVRILGTGGVVASLIYALNQLGINDIEVIYRNKESAIELQNHWKIKIKAITDNDLFQNKDILINSIPTLNNENNDLFSRFISFSTLIFDLIVKPNDTALIKMALLEKKDVIHGYEMAAYQLMEQFYIYFNQKLEFSEVLKVINTEYFKVSYSIPT